MLKAKRDEIRLLACAFAALFCGTSFAATSQSGLQAGLQDLKAGNQRYVSGHANHCRIDDQKLAAHQSKQAPDAVILSCSDSRVPPERIFDQDIGDLFTVRVAGNVLNEDVIASIEYAIGTLGARLIVVMGHDSCGAIKAALSKKTDQDAGSPNVNHLIQEIRGNLGQFNSTDPLFRDAAKKNVSAVADELVKRSKLVREGVQSGKLQIAQAMYSLSSGKVDFAGE